jgi:hypothetical protein
MKQAFFITPHIQQYFCEITITGNLALSLNVGSLYS